MRINYWKYLDAYRRSLDNFRLLLCKAQLVLLYPNMETWPCFRNKHVIHTGRSLNMSGCYATLAEHPCSNPREVILLCHAGNVIEIRVLQNPRQRV